MATHRFFGIKRFTQEAIDSHQRGKPFIPSGCRGKIQLVYYNDESPEGFPGSLQIHGNQITATSFPEYIHTLNHILDKGADINVNSAIQNGRFLTCGFTLSMEAADAKTISPEAEIQDTDEQETVEAEVEAVADQGDVETEAEKLPESTEDESTSTIKTSPDWDHAKSLMDTDRKCGAKQALKEYAAEFDIKLNKVQKFANMMKHFKAEFDGD